MVALAINGGFYQSRSVIASAQRCLNMYPEINTPESYMVMPQMTASAIVTLYPTPGTKPLSVCPAPGAGRGLYYGTNGQLYAIVANAVYVINNLWQWQLLGWIQLGTTPVSMKDNAVTLVLVDGSTNGYTIEFAGNIFGTIEDPTDFFSGADRVDIIDGFFVFNKPNTPQFYCSLDNEVSFNPLYFANKQGSPDWLVSIAVIQRTIWLIGKDTTELWYDAGNANFPFALNTANFIHYGCSSKYSVAQADTELFWLGRNPQGDRFVVMASGTSATIVSTPAIQNEFASYRRIDDAIGWCYQQVGHTFYVLTFPSEDRTWVYDTATELWHERGVNDGYGHQHRLRANAYAFAYGKHVCMDFETGAIYEMDIDTYTDMGAPIVRERTFPHLVNELKRMSYRKFVADMETGNTTVPDNDTTFGDQPLVSLSWSDDRGVTYNSPIRQPLGTQGRANSVVQFWRLGMARDRVFKLQWSSPSRTALNGAFLEVTPSAT